MIHPLIVKIRERACHTCKNQCDEYKSGSINHRDPLASCPLRVWPAVEAVEAPVAPSGEVPPAGMEIEPMLGHQPGAVLKWAIWKLTGVRACGQCSDRSRQMDRWGWVGCWRNRKKIIGWLIHEARARDQELTQKAAGELILSAFKQFNFIEPRKKQPRAPSVRRSK